MQLEHSFTVPTGIEEAWAVLLDVERIAPCMPGAALDTVDGDEFTGSVKVKLGPINLTYKGKAQFVEKDADAHRVLIDARGKDARGAGTAAAKITATLAEAGSQTQVHVQTELDITGKPAQFGRGVMVDVGNKIIGQFAACLAEQLSTPAAEPEPESEPAAAPGSGGAPESGATTDSVAAPESVAAPASAETPAQAEQVAAETAPPAAPAPARPATPPRPESSSGRKLPSAEPIDLLESAGPAVAKRLAPVLAALVVLILIARRLRR